SDGGVTRAFPLPPDRSVEQRVGATVDDRHDTAHPHMVRRGSSGAPTVHARVEWDRIERAHMAYDLRAPGRRPSDRPRTSLVTRAARHAHNAAHRHHPPERALPPR